LQAIYPDRQWISSDYKPRGYWKDLSNQRLFFDELAVKLNIQKPEDWKKVTFETVKKEGGHFVKAYYSTSVMRGKELG
jgi:hypothetical protein